MLDHSSGKPSLKSRPQTKVVNRFATGTLNSKKDCMNTRPTHPLKLLASITGVLEISNPPWSIYDSDRAYMEFLLETPSVFNETYFYLLLFLSMHYLNSITTN